MGRSIGVVATRYLWAGVVEDARLGTVRMFPNPGQPQIDLKTGRPVAVESLARLRHPRVGLLGPGLFVPLCEQRGMLFTMTRVVVRKSIEQVAAWRSAGSFPGLRTSERPSPRRYATAAPMMNPRDSIPRIMSVRPR